MILTKISCSVLRHGARKVSTRGGNNVRFKIPIRSMLFPKNSRSCLENVANSLNPDIVVLDLEDSVQPCERSSVLKMYQEVLKDGILSRFRVFIRTSSLDSKDDIFEDIQTFTGSGIIGFVLPKVENPTSIFEIDNFISVVEKEKGITKMFHKLMPTAETPAAYFCLDKIASASDRNIVLLAGSGDFTAEVVCNDHSLAYNAFFSKTVLAARAAGIGAVCGVHDKIDDHIGFENFCFKMKHCGFNGVAALTPKQILQANNIFSMTPKDANWVENVLKVDSNGNSVKVIQPSIQESRQMIGPPHRLKAQNMKKLFHVQKNSCIKSIIKGVTPSKGMRSDLSVGEIVRSPNRLILGESWKTLWNSSFLGNGSGVTNTSLQLPFSLAATMTVALSVSTLSYHARVHLAFKNIFQHRPLVAGDIVQALYRIEGTQTKKGSDGNQYSIVTSSHWLTNQANEIVLQLEKVTMFLPENCKLHLRKAQHANSLKSSDSILLESILQCPPEKCFPMQSQPKLIPRQLFFHDLVKVMGHSETRMLCNLLGIVNQHHHNKMRYSSFDLLVPGPFVMSAGIANTALDLGEILYEDIPLCINPNKVNFGDQIGTLTYIVDCNDVEGKPGYEEVLVKHIVVKNVDMEILSQLEIPLELFESDTMKPSDIEALCANSCPILLHKIACVIVRKMIRVCPGVQSPFQLPKELC